MKVEVYCGPELEIGDVLKEYSNAGEIADAVMMFPEKTASGRRVREHVRTSCEIYNSLLIVTRYPQSLYELGALIEERQVKPEDVSIYLLRDDKFSVHSFNVNGVLQNNWPFGILD